MYNLKKKIIIIPYFYIEITHYLVFIIIYTLRSHSHFNYFIQIHVK